MSIKDNAIFKTAVNVTALAAGFGTSIIVKEVIKNNVSSEDYKLLKRACIAVAGYFIAGAAAAYVNRQTTVIINGYVYQVEQAATKIAEKSIS
jgi:hypothetical protein